MIHYWKVPELEITDFDYKHDRTPSPETIRTRTSNPQTCRDHKVSDKPTYDTLLESS